MCVCVCVSYLQSSVSIFYTLSKFLQQGISWFRASCWFQHLWVLLKIESEDQKCVPVSMSLHTVCTESVWPCVGLHALHVPATVAPCPAESVRAVWCSCPFPAPQCVSLPHSLSERLLWPEAQSEFSAGHSAGPAAQRREVTYSFIICAARLWFGLLAHSQNTLTWLCFSVTSLCCSTSCKSEFSLSLNLITSSPCLWLCLRLLWLASSSRPRENRELCAATSSPCTWASVKDSLTPSGAWRKNDHGPRSICHQLRDKISILDLGLYHYTCTTSHLALRKLVAVGQFSQLTQRGVLPINQLIQLLDL